MAFKNSTSDGGASVIQVACIESKHSLVCSHIDKYYRNIGGDPPVFWRFDESILPQGYEIEQKTSDTGDDCHQNVMKISNNRWWKFFKKISWTEFSICDSGAVRPLTQADLEGFQRA